MSKRLQLLTGIIIPSSVLLVIGGYIYSNAVRSQKEHSSLFKGLMFHLRHDPQTTKLLGDRIKFDETKEKVKGVVNNTQGYADIIFNITGEKGNGTVTFKGRRIEPDIWRSNEFSLERDGVVLNLSDS